jgi:hypothetical protein
VTEENCSLHDSQEAKERRTEREREREREREKPERKEPEFQYTLQEHAPNDQLKSSH